MGGGIPWPSSTGVGNGAVVLGEGGMGELGVTPGTWKTVGSSCN